MKVSTSIVMMATVLLAEAFGLTAAFAEPAAQTTECPATISAPTAAPPSQTVVATQVTSVDPSTASSAPAPFAAVTPADGLAAAPAPAPAAAPAANANVDSSFQVRYADKLNIGDSVVDFRKPEPSPPAAAPPPPANLTATPTADCTTAAARTIPAASATSPTGVMAPIADDVTAPPMPPANLKCKAGKKAAQLTKRSGKTVWRCVKATG